MASPEHPTIVGFKQTYQQVRKEEGTVKVCLMRKRHLYQEGEVTVLTMKQGEGKVLAFIVGVICENWLLWPPLQFATC